MIKKKSKKMYEYLDGNGNKYIIKNDAKIILEYIPIKPPLSSSGIYNGGKYLEKEINTQDWSKLVYFINEAVSNKAIHIKNRIKKSGMIIIQGKNKKKTYIIEPNSKELLEIENFLKSIIHTSISL
jgi:hypothetical protein